MGIVITVSRQLGSRGSYVAAAVAKALNLRYLDREILYRAAELVGYPDEAMVTQLERRERIPNFLERVLGAVEDMPPIPTIASATMREGYAYDDRLASLMAQESLSRTEALHDLTERARRAEASETYIELIQRVIREVAGIGAVIIVGRGGQVILKDHPQVLHVRVHAPAALRARRLVERLGFDAREAERQVSQSDRERARYLKHYFGEVWDDPSLYHLVLNTARLTTEAAAHLIVTAASGLGSSVPDSL